MLGAIVSIRWQPGSGCTSKDTTASELFLISHWTWSSPLLLNGNLQCVIFDITLWFGWQCAGGFSALSVSLISTGNIQ